MLTTEEATATIQFLDRVSITGHSERQAMNTLVQKFAIMSQPPAPPVPDDIPEPCTAID